MEDLVNSSSSPVVIFGAGIVGIALFNACCEKGIKVECFCDNSVTGKLRPCSSPKWPQEIEVLSLEEVKKRFNDAQFILSTCDLGGVIKQLEEEGYFKWHSCIELLSNFNSANYSYEVSLDFVKYAIDICLVNQENYLDKKLFIRSVDIVVTEKCNLRCKNCANLAQYYTEPQDSNPQELLASVDLLCSAIDGIGEFRVIGGETLVAKNLLEILPRLLKEEKVRRVLIYTNGTIVPSNGVIEYLKSDKIVFMITNYEKLSKNISKLKQALVSEGISFYEFNAGLWTDSASIERQDRTKEQQLEVYKKCCAKPIITLLKGKLYHCPFMAHADNLRAIPEYKEYIDLCNPIRRSEVTRVLIKEFLDRESFNSCSWCKGREFDKAEIRPAIQVRKPREYLRYERRN